MSAIYPIGRFIPGDSTLHRLDPRSKMLGLAALLTAGLLSSSLRTAASLGAFCLLGWAFSSLRAMAVLRDVWSLRYLLAITILVHIATALWLPAERLAGLPWDDRLGAGLTTGLVFSVKFALIAALMSLTLRTTHAGELPEALSASFPAGSRVGKPLRRLVFILGMALRFLPLLLEEAQRIRQAQAGRGLKTGGSLIDRVRALIPLIVPLLDGALRRIDTTALAMESRGFKLDAPRSVYKPFSFAWRDLAALLIVGLGLAVIWL